MRFLTRPCVLPGTVLAALLASFLALPILQSPAATPPQPLPPPIEFLQTANQFNARIDDWSFPRLLRELVRTTGWEIYVEPGQDRPVSARFRNLPASEALRRLLGDLNFALLPQDNGSIALYIYRTSLQEATQAFLPDRTARTTGPDARALSNELIVTLKKDGKETIEALAARLGAKIVGRIDGAGAYRLQFEDATAADTARTALETDPNVQSVDANQVVQAPTRFQPLAAGSPPSFSLKPRKVPPSGQTIVGLIDSAVQSTPLLKDFLLPGQSVTGSPPTPESGGPSHGTSMAEALLRAAAATGDSGESSIRILSIDVYGGASQTTSFEVAAGIYAAAQGGARIINLSLGSESGTAFLQRTIQQAAAEGILLLAAAGNLPVTSPTYPAAYPEVLAVTAGDRTGQVANYANRGEFVDLIAPGTGVFQFNQQTYLGTGTSFASAYASGAAATLASTLTDKARIESELRKQLGVPKPAKP